ncbi:MAG: AarF/UbiB family protein [Bacteroidota bacterium]
MARNKIYNPAWRTRKAYWTTTVVIFSYLRLFLAKKMLGKKYYEKRILKLHIKNAERVKKAILELNGLFIKIGQLLSILSNFLPEAFQKPLEELQDRIPPRPFHEVEKRIINEFGKKPLEIFQSIDEMPLASASIGQAHRAKLPDGTDVVVKVQHHNIEGIAKVDLEIIRKLNKLVGWFYDIKGLDYVYTQIRKMIEEELDFKQEARSMQTIRENLKEEAGLVIPEVHLAYSTMRTMTTTWHEGVKIANTAQLDTWQVDKQDVVARLLKAYCKMVFKDGFYHADPHPGNILVKADGTIVLLDFGAVAHLGQKLKDGIPQLIEAAIKNDNTRVISTMRQMGFLADGYEANEMAEKMINALRNFLQNEVKLEGLNFKDIEIDPFNNSMFDLIQDIGLSGIAGTVQMPKDFVLMNRMLTLLLGISNSLAPELNPLHVVRPYVKEYVMGESDDLVSMVSGFFRRSVSTAIGIPDELHRVLQIIEKEKLITRTPDIKESAKLFYQVAQQFLYAILIIAAASFGYLFWRNGEKELGQYAFFTTGIFAFLLIRSIRKGNKIHRRMY